jgi:D-3-phosphoglycerate dehydrogenase
VLVVRHADQVGVLAGVLDVLREGEHNVQEMQNIVFHGAEAACARIAVVGQPDRATVDRIRSYGHVFDVTVAEAR